MRNRNLIILGAILSGLLYVGPPLMIWRHFHNAGQPFVLAQFKTYRDSLMVYLPRAREVFDGHFPPGELFSAPLHPTIQNVVPSLLFGSLIFLFNGNINLSYLAAQFIFSGVIFALFYLIGWTMFRSRLWSLLLGFSGVITPIAVKLPFYKWQGWSEFQAFFINNFIPFARTQVDQMFLARIDEPLLTFPFYLAAILSFFVFWRKPRRFWAIISGIAAGLVFYVYFHHWVYWVIVLGLLFIYTAIFRRDDKERLKNFCLLFGVLALVAIPYFVNYFSFHSISTAQDFIYREGVIYGRQLGIGASNIKDYIFYAILWALTIFFYWKKDRLKAILFSGLILAMFISWNIQLVIGYSPVPHFFQRSFSPVLFLILFNFIHDLVKKLELRAQFWRKAVVVVLIFLISSAVIKKASNIISMSVAVQPALVDYYRFPADVVKSWDWINANLGKEPVIISPSTIESMYLNTYTSARPYLATGFLSLLSTSEMENRYLISHKLFGASEQIFQQRLLGNFKCPIADCIPDGGSNLNDSLWHLYGNYFLSRTTSIRGLLNGSADSKLVQKRSERTGELMERYRNLNPKWSDTGANYVYLGPWENQFVNPDFSKDKELSLVYSNDSVKIYRIK